MPLKKLFIKRLAISLLLIFLFGCGHPFHRSDQVLEKLFSTYEKDFNTLVTMSNEDSKVIRIAYDFTRLENNWSWPRPESELGFSRERWDEYRKLFRKVGAYYGINRTDDGSVLLDISCRGTALDSDCKGIGYLPKEPPAECLKESLDEDQIKIEGSHKLVYKRIKDHWYIYRWVWG